MTFDDAMHVFEDPDALFEQDRTEAGELRWQALGLAEGIILLLVAHTVKARRRGRGRPHYFGTSSDPKGTKTL